MPFTGLIQTLAAATAISLVVTTSSPASAAAPTAERAIHYRLEDDASTVHVLTGSSGLLGFIGHEHVIDVPRFSGEALVDSTDATHFTLEIAAPADSLRVVDDDSDSRLKIEKDMKEDVLESSEYPTIALRGVGFEVSTSEGADAGAGAAAWGTYTGRLTLAINLHGRERTIAVPLELEISPDRLRARGKFSIRHSDFDMERKKVAGVVNVAQKLEIEYDVIGRAAP